MDDIWSDPLSISMWARVARGYGVVTQMWVRGYITFKTDYIHQLLTFLPCAGLGDPNLGADPGFLERGFICRKGWEVRFADFTSFFLNNL